MKTGNPNGEGLAEWTSYTEESPCAMEFGGRNEMFPYSGSPVSQFEKAFFQGDFKARKGAELGDKNQTQPFGIAILRCFCWQTSVFLPAFT